MRRPRPPAARTFGWHFPSEPRASPAQASLFAQPGTRSAEWQQTAKQEREQADQGKRSESACRRKGSKIHTDNLARKPSTAGDVSAPTGKGPQVL